MLVAGGLIRGGIWVLEVGVLCFGVLFGGLKWSVVGNVFCLRFCCLW